MQIGQRRLSGVGSAKERRDALLTLYRVFQSHAHTTAKNKRETFSLGGVSPL